MSLADNRIGILEVVKENLGIIACGDPVSLIGSAFEDLTQAYQGLAICNLLTTMDPAGFVKNLVFSGYTRRYFLRRHRSDEAPDNRFLAISRTEAFFDAIAGGAYSLARDIAQLSPKHSFADGEYEDDFAYFAFFHAWLIADGKPLVGDLSSLLTQFVKATEGKATPRSNICESFLNRDGGAFTAAFTELMENRQSEMKKMKVRAGDDLTFDPRAAVFVEGLAILELAKQAGFPTEEEYALCPGIARALDPQMVPEDFFIEIDRIIHKHKPPA